MKYCRKFLTAATVIMLLGLSTQAQQKNEAELEAEEIFNSMMLSMPKEMKSRVDSAASIQKPTDHNIITLEKLTPQQMDSLKRANGRVIVEKLSPELREQVRKTMESIEQSQAERMIEFKESRSRQKN